jgi:hypothetical protein
LLLGEHRRGDQGAAEQQRGFESMAHHTILKGEGVRL